jgi:hypothetical protein
MFFDDDFEFFEEMNENFMSSDPQRYFDPSQEQAWEKHPLFQKATEVLNIVHAMVQCVPEERRELFAPVQVSAMALCAKFAAVHGCKDWLSAMQLAALMRYHSEYITLAANAFEIEGDDGLDRRYVELLREEMDEYVRLFAEWMNSVHALPKTEDFDTDPWNVYRR